MDASHENTSYGHGEDDDQDTSAFWIILGKASFLVLLGGFLMYFGPSMFGSPDSRSKAQLIPILIGAMWAIPSGFRSFNSLLTAVKEVPPPFGMIIAFAIVNIATFVILLIMGINGLSSPIVQSPIVYVLILLGGAALLRFGFSLPEAIRKSKFEQDYFNSLNEDEFLNAIATGNIGLVKELVDNGADVNRKDMKGISVLLHATNNNQREVAKYLIEREADVNTKDLEGNTPLMLASLFGPLENVRAILSKRANINAKNKDGMTALMYAVWDADNADKEIVKELLDHGADIETENYSGISAIDAAKENDLTEILHMLEETKKQRTEKRAQSKKSKTKFTDQSKIVGVPVDKDKSKLASIAEVSPKFCIGCGKALPDHIQKMFQKSDATEWCREGYCSLKCFQENK